MELCDCEFLCTSCSAALMPFFSVGNLEFKVLNHCNDANKIKYDEYFSPCKLSKLSSTLTKNDFFIQHFNVRSLPKNKEKIEEFFDDMTRLPDVIAISETKLNSNSVSNLNLPNYTFLRKDSPTCAGGVGFYIKGNMQYRLRNDLTLNIQHCEDLWIELETKKTNFIIAVIYRHPNKLLLSFQEKLCNTLTDLENSNLNYIVCGDINVNYFAKDNEKIADYMNNLAMIGCKMKINNHTRFGENCRPSLLDHIYRGGVEDTRLEAKDTKKIRGQGQGQPFRGQNLSRPRTGMLEAKDSLSEDRTSRGQGQECSRPRPRTKDTAASVLQKKGLQKSFPGNLQFKGVARIFDWGGLNHKSHAVTSSKICLLFT